MRLVSKDGKLSTAILEGLPEVAAVGQDGPSTFCLRRTPQERAIYLSYGQPRGSSENGTSVARARLVTDRNGGAHLEDVKVIFRQQPATNSAFHFGSRLATLRCW
jgi:aldose sugar dehydrogenase